MARNKRLVIGKSCDYLVKEIPQGFLNQRNVNRATRITSFYCVHRVCLNIDVPLCPFAQYENRQRWHIGNTDVFYANFAKPAISC